MREKEFAMQTIQKNLELRAWRIIMLTKKKVRLKALPIIIITKKNVN